MDDDRYNVCLRRVKSYVAELRDSNVNRSAIEGLVRSYVDQPAYDATHRERLIKDALAGE
jgi:hypothetical protein